MRHVLCEKRIIVTPGDLVQEPLGKKLFSRKTKNELSLNVFSVHFYKS